MKTESEAIYFLKGAEGSIGKKCFVRHVHIGGFDKWKIFTSEEDYESYIKTRKHKDKEINFTAIAYSGFECWFEYFPQHYNGFFMFVSV